jgi:hypothetical protein
LDTEDSLPKLQFFMQRPFFSLVYGIPQLGPRLFLKTLQWSADTNSSGNPVDSVMALMPQALGGLTLSARRLSLMT